MCSSQDTRKSEGPLRESYILAYAVVIGCVLSAAHGVMRVPVETFDNLEAPGRKSLLEQLSKV